MAFVDTLSQSITPLYMPQGNFLKKSILNGQKMRGHSK